MIREISDYQSAVAAAVEEQSATTSELAHASAQSARGTQDIVGTIGAVASATATTYAVAGGTTDSAQELRQVSDRMAQLVSAFRL